MKMTTDAQEAINKINEINTIYRQAIKFSYPEGTKFGKKKFSEYLETLKKIIELK